MSAGSSLHIPATLSVLWLWCIWKLLLNCNWNTSEMVYDLMQMLISVYIYIYLCSFEQLFLLRSKTGSLWHTGLEIWVQSFKKELRKHLEVVCEEELKTPRLLREESYGWWGGEPWKCQQPVHCWGGRKCIREQRKQAAWSWLFMVEMEEKMLSGKGNVVHQRFKCINFPCSQYDGIFWNSIYMPDSFLSQQDASM